MISLLIPARVAESSKEKERNQRDCLHRHQYVILILTSLLCSNYSKNMCSYIQNSPGTSISGICDFVLSHKILNSRPIWNRELGSSNAVKQSLWEQCFYSMHYRNCLIQYRLLGSKKKAEWNGADSPWDPGRGGLRLELTGNAEKLQATKGALVSMNVTEYQCSMSRIYIL